MSQLLTEHNDEVAELGELTEMEHDLTFQIWHILFQGVPQVR